MDVAVKAGQDSMPAGLSKILELLGNSLDVSDPAGTLEVNSNLLLIENGKETVRLIATYKDGSGLLAPDKLTITGRYIYYQSRGKQEGSDCRSEKRYGNSPGRGNGITLIKT